MAAAPGVAVPGARRRWQPIEDRVEGVGDVGVAIRGDGHIVEKGIGRQAVAKVGKALPAVHVVDGDKAGLAAGDEQMPPVIERQAGSDQSGTTGQECGDVSRLDIAPVYRAVDRAADEEVACRLTVGDPYGEEPRAGKGEQPPPGDRRRGRAAACAALAWADGATGAAALGPASAAGTISSSMRGIGFCCW